MTTPERLLKKLYSCPAGITGWKRFENVCISILTFLFVPPLERPRLQPRSYSGINRRDAIFPNRNFDTDTNWGKLYHELNARLILVEFKNYDSEDIGKDEVNQIRNYLTNNMGRLALLCCNKSPCEEAHKTRNSIFSSQEKKVILFLWKEHLKEMIYTKQRGEEPSDLLMDLLEEFYIQHE